MLNKHCIYNNYKAMDKNQRLQSEGCAICLSKVKKETRLDSCGHCFCFSCISKWSKRENTCPLCKERFTKIRKTVVAKSSRQEQQRVSHIHRQSREQRVEHQNQIQEDESMEENIFSVLTRPETRNNHLKFWEVYSFIDEMLEQ